MNTEDFVTYEQALALKKLGFRENCLYHYNHHELTPNEFMNDAGYYYIRLKNLYRSMNIGYPEQDNICDAPTLAQAQKWLREKNIIICINPRFYRGIKPLMGYDYSLYKDNLNSYIDSDTIYDSYEEALSAGITECLKLLEK